MDIFDNDFDIEKVISSNEINNSTFKILIKKYM